MKNQRIKCIIFVVIVLLFSIFGVPNTVKAATTSMFFGIQEFRRNSLPEPNMAFAIGQPGSGDSMETKSGSVLWKIIIMMKQIFIV